MKPLALAALLLAAAGRLQAAHAAPGASPACEGRVSDLAFLIKSTLAGRPDVQAFQKAHPTAEGLTLFARGSGAQVVIGPDALRKYDFAVVPRARDSSFSLLDLRAQDDPALASCAFINNDHGVLAYALAKGVGDAADYQARQGKIDSALKR